jgi:hypothetical protein
MTGALTSAIGLLFNVVLHRLAKSAAISFYSFFKDLRSFVTQESWLFPLISKPRRPILLPTRTMGRRGKKRRK